MPTLYKPNLVHILCNDPEYEYTLFKNLNHDQSDVIQLKAKAKKQHVSTTSNTIRYCSSPDVTHYEELKLFILGNYKSFYDSSNASSSFLKLDHPLHPNDCKSFCAQGYSQSFVSTLMVSQNVTNWITADMLKLIHDSSAQSVFVHLKQDASQDSQSPRTQAIINFAKHNKMPFFEENPLPTNQDWIHEFIKKIESIKPSTSTSIDKWNSSQLKNFKTGSEIDEFLFCPMVSDYNLKEFKETKKFNKNTPFMKHFNKNWVEFKLQKPYNIKLTQMINHNYESNI